MKRLTTEDFIEKSKEKHNDKYDYSLVKYKNAHSKVKIICHNHDYLGNEHGVFEIAPYSHLSGHGCPKCGGSNILSIDEWIYKAKQIHGNKYDYSKITDTRSSVKGIIICPLHGEFRQNLNSHLQGAGCPMCKSTLAYSKKTFIDKANIIHNSFYNYDKFVYNGNKVKGLITCPIHGDFLQTPEKHLYGRGCPKCKSSKMEDEIIRVLNENNIKYDYQSKILNLGLKTVDFYLNEYGIIIECQGNHHFKPIKYSYSMTDDGLTKQYIKQVKSDEEKYETALKMGYKIFYYFNPNIIEDKTINCKYGFYKDKNVYTDKETLITDVLQNEKNNSICLKENAFKMFINDFKQNVSKHFTTSNNGGLNIKNYAIHFHELKHNERDDLNKISRENRKLNINTIHIFEDEYYERGNIIFKKLKHILNLDNNNKQKIMARKCIIKEIDSTSAFDFLNKNHIQGSVPATIYLGAFYNDNIIGVMTFLHEGKNKWNLNRFASDNNYICSGIGGKLFKYFIKNYEYDEIKSFADKRWTINEDDNVYIKLGFKKDMILSPEYRYINGEEKIRYHKFGFRKQILIKKYPNAGLNINMTEREMTEKLGYQRIWDCGLIKYVYKL